MKITYDSIRFYVWIFMIITLLLALCCSCSAEYHLKKAVHKNPELSLSDTVQKYTTLPGVTARFEIDKILQSKHPVIVEDVKFKTIVRDSVRFVTVECPPNELVTKYVPKIKFITEELTTRQIVNKAKNLSEFQRFRIANTIIWGAFLFGIFIGIIFVIIIRLKFFG